MTDRAQRRLAAIVSADVVGYSRLMGRNERGTLEALKKHRAELIDDAIAEHGGRIVKTTGDGLLAEFASVMDAVECCVAVQEGMAKRNIGVADEEAIQFRIGVHLGDIIVDGDDIFGDGVNIAARLQEIGEPSGIVVSAIVYDYLDSALAGGFVDLGERELKNIRRPVKVWQRSTGVPEAPATRLPVASEPSIAVLAFSNMSGDQEQEYFSDGISEDIITELSRFPWLKVIARNTSFTYKGRAVDLKQVGRELGVRYVLEGSVRRAANRVRVTAQLIDAESGSQVWAERYDRELADIFELQDEITRTIAGTVAPSLESAELNRSRRRAAANLDSWDLVLRARHEYSMPSDGYLDRALVLLRQAVAYDPDNATALSIMAAYLCDTVVVGQSASPEEALREAAGCAQRALKLDRNDAVAMMVLGFIAAMSGEHERGRRLAERAVALNPNDFYVRLGLGLILIWNAEYEPGIAEVDAAIRRSPNDPLLVLAYTIKSFAYIQLNDALSAVNQAEQGLEMAPDSAFILRTVCVAYMAFGDVNSGRRYARQFLEIAPDFTISGFVASPRFSDKVDLSFQAELFRAAGLPE